MSPTSFETLNEDVIYQVATRCLKPRVILVNLASTCRLLRCHCMPILFSTCFVQASASEADRIPPVAIRPYIRFLIYTGRHSQAESLGDELNYLPHVCSVTFEQATNGVPITVLQRCLKHPLASLSFAQSSRWTIGPRQWPLPAVGKLPNTLERLDYPLYPWKATRAFHNNTDVGQEAEHELRHLGPIVLGMHLSATSLSSPVDAVPLAAMSKLSWPKLADLNLSGRYRNQSHARDLQQFCSCLDSLRSIVLHVTQPVGCARAPIFGRRPTRALDTSQLQSLSVAYPDPDDAILSQSCSALRRLALRDYPRYYLQGSPRHEIENKDLAVPILSSSECLRILTRMAPLSLQHLELVYGADQAEEALLLHVASSYPRLEAIQLHQYRTSRGSEALHFRRIADILASMTTLRTVNLNLDYEDASPSYVYDPEGHDEWRSRLARYGGDMLGTLERACPALEGLFLLYHDDSDRHHFWVRFVPSRHPGYARIDWDWARERLDCEPPYRHQSRIRRRDDGTRREYPVVW
ncbi:hypothetical protein K466DRAFT_666413 [Polyporus arcularius HHB13444]|uniref:F-box domain-containing protein n=1 Tax=Polyporus arcularius HHB13444 TaxID=1314778 RepID=A0A5C3NYS1_9APHY|nr:hypothetical protein K466DRAFT_666413 [Polyporus arcularius HHB13444]